MRQMQRKAVVWIGRLAMFFGLLLVMNMTAHAQFEENVYQKSGIPYIDLVWDEVTATMYTTQKFVEADTKRVTASTTSLSEGWYVVEGEVMAASRITVSGTVHLILCDGADFQVEDGIQVHDGSSLYLYAQSEGTDMGMLKADGDEYQAGIGGGYREAGGNIIINGGAATAMEALERRIISPGSRWQLSCIAMKRAGAAVSRMAGPLPWIMWIGIRYLPGPMNLCAG